jgi:hypothetical protein
MMIEPVCFDKTITAANPSAAPAGQALSIHRGESASAHALELFTESIHKSRASAPSTSVRSFALIRSSDVEFTVFCFDQ